MNEIELKPSDFNEMVKLMDKYGKADDTYWGRNENDELTWISIYENRIVTLTYQQNGWARENIYHDDGTSEELFLGRYEQ